MSGTDFSLWSASPMYNRPHLATRFRHQAGPYEIVSLVGAGGMGEVYKARDARLGRDVAIKILPASITNEGERLKRFEQEARSVAALNHPNILTIYEIEAHDGSPYLVSELLEGETLRSACAKARFPSAKRWTSRCRPRTASPPLTKKASSIAT